MNFPQDDSGRRFVLAKYASQIWLSAKWCQDAFEEFQQLNHEPYNQLDLHRKAMEVLIHAMSIARMLDASKPRVEFLRSACKEPWPDAPKELREVRNGLEHFEERLDRWVEESMYIGRFELEDLRVGPRVDVFTHAKSHLRRLEGTTLYFWEFSVDLTEVCKWANDVKAHFDRLLPTMEWPGTTKRGD